MKIEAVGDEIRAVGKRIEAVVEAAPFGEPVHLGRCEEEEPVLARLANKEDELSPSGALQTTTCILQVYIYV